MEGLPQGGVAVSVRIGTVKMGTTKIGQQPIRLEARQVLLGTFDVPSFGALRLGRGAHACMHTSMLSDAVCTQPG